MRRSLLARLLVVSVTVAAFAIAATAWLTTRGTSNALRDDIERTLEGDNRIYQDLLAYGQQHPSWDGVDAVVERLAGETGQRIALTDADGRLLADSAGGDDGDPPGLPPSPASSIDPLSRALTLTTLPSSTSAAATTAASPIGSLPEPGDDGDGKRPEIPTPIERDRARAASDGAECLSNRGYPSRPLLTDPWSFPEALADIEWEHAPSEAIAECIPAVMFAPTEDELALGDAVKLSLVACVAQGTNEHEACLDQAIRTARDPYRADAALLYLGNAEESRFGSLWDVGRRRTAATVVVVLALTAVVTVLAGRRLVRPIRALTGAVRRMEAGDPTARVPVRGHDEVARLAGAFNAMAESIELGAEQRRALVSDVAHELRTPLANIQGYLEGAQDGVVDVDPALVASLLEESTVLGRLVDDLQELALADAGRLRLHPEDVDAADVAEVVVAAHGPAASAADVELAVSAPHAVPVRADPARLRQAVGNLVGNALRYTPPGGRVTVWATALDGRALVVVQDTGIGIAAEHLPHIFDRFYRVDASRNRATGGSGLGLAITRHLVEAHGGTIDATSAEGEGTTVTIRLPSASAAGVRRSRDQRRVGPVQ